MSAKNNQVSPISMGMMSSAAGDPIPMKSFWMSLGAITTILVVLFCTLVEYSSEDGKHATAAQISHFGEYFFGVSIMIFIGFGFLMTFLKRYGYGALVINFVASCMLVLEGIFVIGLINQVIDQGESKVQLSLDMVFEGLFCAGTGMITLGAVLGKTTPTQVIWLLALEAPIYALNQYLVFHKLKAADVGGSITVHAFGAYFGVGAVMVLARESSEHPKHSSWYVSNLLSMIGTLFLWVYWPAFNGALVHNPARQFFVNINTMTSLLGACLATAMVSPAINGRISMEHIQNATLAGGVAIGSSANFDMSPGVALIIGLLSGVLSTAGFGIIGPFLESKLGLRDTCGVHNLHGMPAVFAALTSAITAKAYYDNNSSILARDEDSAGLYQVAGIVVTVAIAGVSGAAVAFAVKSVTPARERITEVNAEKNCFEDGLYFVDDVLPLDKEEDGAVAMNA